MSIKDALAKLNQSLNTEQRLAAETTEGPVMVVAGAGAGKTKTLIHRVASLMVKGVPAANIMVVTFTNQAAKEIKNRLEQMIGENGQYVHAGTFHSIIFKKILQPYAHSEYLVGQNIDMRECAILDDKEAGSLLKDAISELPEADREQIEENDWKVADFEKIMSLERAKGHDVYDFFSRLRPGSTNEEKHKIAAAIWRSYNQKCREVNGIDFDDILLYADKMLKKEPGLAEELSRQFRYLMLDEYQDTNPVQMSIMDSIAAHHQNIFTVGDEKQSIYKFRGADINVIMSFQKRYPDTKMVNMNKNYRSYPEVIRHANALADAMKQRLSDGQLRCERAIDESPEALSSRKVNKAAMVSFPTDQEEAKAVSKAIIRDMALGLSADRIAVLYRNRALKNELEKVLVDLNVPYEMVGDTSFFQKSEVKDAVGLIRFIFHPWDSVAGIRVLKSTSMRVSDKAAKKAMKEAGSNVHEFLRSQSEKRLRAKRKGQSEPDLTETAKKVAPFIKLSKMLRESVEFGDSPAYITDVLSEIWGIYMRPGIEDKAKRSSTAESDHSVDLRVENVQHVFRRVREQLEDGMQISEIIEDLSMMVDNNANSERDSEPKVKLMTMHASKGLEFDHVYIIGLDSVTTHGDEPEDTDDEEIEESRRLVYVGMTRAEKKLTVSYSRQRMHYGSTILADGSPFLDEIESRIGVKRITLAEKSDQQTPEPTTA